MLGLAILFYLIIPIVFIAWIWHQTPKNRWIWALNSTFVGLYLINLYLTGAWPFVGIPFVFRYLFLVFFAVALLRSFPRVNREKLPLKRKAFSILGYGILVVFSGILSWEIVSAVKGRSPSEDTIVLEFPMKNGSYYVLHGGSHNVINHHYPVLGQRYALDIVKLNKIGMRSNKITPAKKSDYYIFSEDLFSPVTGTVIEAENGIDDAPKLNIDRENPAGNHLYIQVENTNRAVVLAHLQKGSLKVKKGDHVKQGQLIGKVGNTGNTSEPHLHIHVVEINEKGDFLFDAKPISMIFNNKFLVRNSIYSAK